MRPKERIPIILDNINWIDFINYLGFDNVEDIANKCINNIENIAEIWMNDPDLRLTQVLIYCDILENIPGSWFYIEEVDYMIENKIVKPEKILFWGTYGKDGKQPLKMIAINDMDNEHIEACLKTQKHMNKFYRDLMKKVIRKRKLKNIKK
jgi:hypothetical protein